MIDDLCGVASRSAFIKYCLKEVLKKKPDCEEVIKTIAEYEKYRLINENCALQDMDIIDEKKLDKTIYNLTVEVENNMGLEIINKIKTINIEINKLYEDNYNLKIKSIDNFNNDIINHDETIKNKSISIKNAMDMIDEKQKILSNKFIEYSKNATDYEGKRLYLIKKEEELLNKETEIQAREERYLNREINVKEKEKNIIVKESAIRAVENSIIEETKSLNKIKNNIINQTKKLNDLNKKINESKKELSIIESEMNKNIILKKKQEDTIKNNKEYLHKLSECITENTKILEVQKLNLEYLYNKYPDSDDGF